MDFFITPCILFVLIGILIGYASPKNDWAVQTLILLGLITAISFVLSFIFSSMWSYTLMFACVFIPGIIIGITTEKIATKKAAVNKGNEKISFLINSPEMDALVISILEKVETGKTLYVSSLLNNDNISSNFNKIGWFINSYDFLKKHNADDKYIVYVEFYDKEKRLGDIQDIAISINPIPNPKSIIPAEDYIYKSSDIKYLEIKGLAYRNLSEKHLGKFYGYAKTEKENKYDAYAVAIYNNKEELLGYVPKESKYLFNTLELIGGTEQVWGFIRNEHHEYNNTDKLYGRVYIPIKCSDQKIEKAKSEFKSKKIKRRVNI